MSTNPSHVSFQFEAGSVAHIVIQCPCSGGPQRSLAAPMTVSDWLAVFNQARQIDVGGRPPLPGTARRSRSPRREREAGALWEDLPPTPHATHGHSRGEMVPTTPDVSTEISRRGNRPSSVPRH